MKISSHVLGGEGSGNGHHGHCIHCNLPLVTDLGYDSWEGSTCIEREIESEMDIPAKVANYAAFRGLRWNYKIKKYVRPFHDEEYTIEELEKIINEITIH